MKWFVRTCLLAILAAAAVDAQSWAASPLVHLFQWPPQQKTTPVATQPACAPVQGAEPPILAVDARTQPVFLSAPSRSNNSSAPPAVERGTVTLPEGVEPQAEAVSGKAQAEEEEANNKVPVGTEPIVRRVNDKNLVFNYDVRDLGPSGLAGVEVWFTRDGRAWEKYDGEIKREQPFSLTVPGEGLYGFRLVSRTGFGGGRAAPKPGELPQVWVDVDLTEPVVFLTQVKQGQATRTLTIGWSATDLHFDHKPVSLSYRGENSNDWSPIAANLDSKGTYTWKIPPGTPASFLVRAQAVDLAGNVGKVETPTPVRIDLFQPETFNIRVTTDRK